MSSSGLRDGLIDSAKCTVCNKVFSTRHGTSSMMRHAKRHAEFPNGTISIKKQKKNGIGKKSPASIKKDGMQQIFDENGGGGKFFEKNLK
jgi:DNA topoisomerase IB